MACQAILEPPGCYTTAGLSAQFSSMVTTRTTIETTIQKPINVSQLGVACLYLVVHMTRPPTLLLTTVVPHFAPSRWAVLVVRNIPPGSY